MEQIPPPQQSHRHSLGHRWPCLLHHFAEWRHSVRLAIAWADQTGESPLDVWETPLLLILELTSLLGDDIALVDLLMPEEADDTLDMAIDSSLGSQEPAAAGLLLAGASAGLPLHCDCRALVRKTGVTTVRSAGDLERWIYLIMNSILYYDPTVHGNKQVGPKRPTESRSQSTILMSQQ